MLQEINKNIIHVQNCQMFPTIYVRKAPNKGHVRMSDRFHQIFAEEIHQKFRIQKFIFSGMEFLDCDNIRAFHTLYNF